jgi:uncharacterized protein YodC (DUF2158 family)
MTVRGYDPHEADDVVCDWFEGKNKAKSGTFHEDQLIEHEEELLGPTMG